MGDGDWLDFMLKRIGEEKVGSVERVRARDAFLSERFNLAEASLVAGVEDGSVSPRTWPTSTAPPSPR